MPSPSSNAEFLQQWRHALAPYNMGYKLKLASQLMYRDFIIIGISVLKPWGRRPTKEQSKPSSAN